MAVADPFGLIGQIIDGQLRVDEVIGEGGFSIVYKGEHIGLGEPVAIKCLKLPRKLDPKLAEAFGKRFKDEGRLLYRLSQGSLYIVRSITSGTTIAPSTGVLVPYMALEWLDGHSLVQEFRERRARGKMPLSLEEAVKLFDPAVQALAYAHAQGVVHRDIKPGNLFYTRTREGWKLKVLDFGLAKIFNDEAIGMQQSVKTSGNFFMCSPSYGAPEQFDPRTGAVGPWTDVYSLALVFVESLADKKARHADSMAEAAILALNPATRPTPRSMGVKVPDAVEDIIARAVSMKVEDRPQTCGEFWYVLSAAVRASTPAMQVATPVPTTAPMGAGQTEEAPKTLPFPGASPRPSRPPSPRPNSSLQSTLRMDNAPGPWQAARERFASTPGRGPTPTPPSAVVIPPPAPVPMFAPGGAPPGAMHAAPMRSSSVPPPRRSRTGVILAIGLIVAALLAAAAWGGYVVLKGRAVPRVGAVEARCPSSPT